MKTLEIKGKVRESVGKKNAKLLRKEDHVPCVLYGGKEVVHFSAHEIEFKDLVYTPNVYGVKIKLESKEYSAIIKALQFHPVTDKIVHIDFVETFADKKISIGVPVKLHGFAKGVKEGGKLNLERRKLTVNGLINEIPDSLDINVENLGLGKTIKAGELSFDNITLTDPKNTIVASVKLTRAAKGMEAAAETAGTTATPAAE